MSTMEIVPMPARSAELDRWLPVMSMDLAVERRETIVTAFQKLMQEGQDYGKIPGAGNKPTLLQPGAQKLDNLFGLVPRFIVEDREEDWTGLGHGGEPFFRYLIKCQVLRGEFVMGEAIGECNSWESKYRYRNAERKCPDCGNPSILQTKHKSGPNEGKPKNFWCAPFKGGCGHGFGLEDVRIVGQETGRKPNPEIFDQVNTLMKMAQKRAHVTATINATSASEFFTADLEDSRETESGASGASDQGKQDVAGNPGSASQQGAPPTRPVPEELIVMFRNIDEDPKHVSVAFKMLEDTLLQAGGANGVLAYTDCVKKLRAKHPAGTIIPIPAIKDCLLDLFELSLAVAKPGEFKATDQDLPAGLFPIGDEK